MASIGDLVARLNMNVAPFISGAKSARGTLSDLQTRVVDFASKTTGVDIGQMFDRFVAKARQARGALSDLQTRVVDWTSKTTGVDLGKVFDKFNAKAKVARGTLSDLGGRVVSFASRMTGVDLGKGWSGFIAGAKNSRGVLFELQSRLIDFGSKTSGLNLGRLVSDVMKLGSSIPMLGKVAIAIGLIAGASYLAVKAVSPMVAQYASFDDTMRQVGAVTHATKLEFTALTNTALRLGAETSFTAKEAADGMRYLGMAGFTTKQILQGIPGVMNLARAGAVDMGVAADVATNIGSAFGHTADEIGYVGDVMTVAFTGSNTDVRMMADTMKYAGSVARTAGQSLESVSVAAGVLANNGIQGTLAGTDLKNLMVDLARNETIFGVATADANGEMRDMLDVMKDIGAVTANWSEQEKTSKFFEVFGERSSKSAMQLAFNGAMIDQLRGKMSNFHGEASRIAQQMDEGIGGTGRRISSAWEGVVLTIGGIVSRIAKPFGELLAWGLGALNKLIQWIDTARGYVTTLGGLLGEVPDYSNQAAEAVLDMKDEAVQAAKQPLFDADAMMPEEIESPFKNVLDDIEKLRREMWMLEGTATEASLKVRDMETAGVDGQTIAEYEHLRKNVERLNEEKKKQAEIDSGERQLYDEIGRLSGQIAVFEGRMSETTVKATELLAQGIPAEAVRQFEEMQARYDAAKEKFDRDEEEAREKKKRENQEADERKRYLEQAPKDIFERTRTPFEKLQAELAKVNELHDLKLIDDDTYARFLKQQQEEIAGKTKDDGEPKSKQPAAVMASTTAGYSAIVEAIANRGGKRPTAGEAMILTEQKAANQYLKAMADKKGIELNEVG